MLLEPAKERMRATLEFMTADTGECGVVYVGGQIADAPRYSRWIETVSPAALPNAGLPTETASSGRTSMRLSPTAYSLLYYEVVLDPGFYFRRPGRTP